MFRSLQNSFYEIIELSLTFLINNLYNFHILSTEFYLDKIFEDIKIERTFMLIYS